MSIKLLAALLLVSAAGTSSAAEPVYSLLYSPSQAESPSSQPTSMFEVEPGLFYVLSASVNNVNGASVFGVTSTGTTLPIYSFPPYVNALTLVENTNGELYGAGFYSDSFYFSLKPSGKGLEEYPLPSHWGSAWRTVAAPSGEMYDIIAYAPPGSAPTAFAIAQIDKSGQITTIHQFSGTDGAPNQVGTPLIVGPDGNIYGIGNQQWGGVSPGFIFRVTPSGEYSKLVNFPSFPELGGMPLIVASDGNLYGSFGAGGTNNTGEIYQVTLSGQLQTVASFPATGMNQPETLMQAADGNIYGSTNSNHIFRYNLKTKELTVVYKLNPSGSQGHCTCQLIEGMDGKLYGVTPVGGNYPGDGAIFSLDIGLPPPTPAISQMRPASGTVGQQIMLWGRYLLGATSVSFNGIPATSFQVSSGHSVWVTVPPGAATGPVTITTANGSFTTTEDFTVQ